MKPIFIILLLISFLFCTTSFSFPENILNISIEKILDEEFYSDNDIGENGFVSCGGLVYDISDNAFFSEFKGRDITVEAFNDESLAEKVVELIVTGYRVINYKEFSKNVDYPLVYVSYESVIYDVSHLYRWETGNHFGRHNAGNDLTYELKNQAPHSAENIKKGYPVAFLGFDFEELKIEGKVLVAVDSIIYDLTHFNRWKNGNHLNRHKSAEELTYEIRKMSPHGIGKLKDVFKIGLLSLNGIEAEKLAEDNNYVIDGEKIYDKRLDEIIAIIVE